LLLAEVQTSSMPIILILLVLLSYQPAQAQEKPRVFIFTDINIDAGDPDDRQSLTHLLWYADELQIEGIVPDRWEAKGYEACSLVLDAFSKDFITYNWASQGYPTVDDMRKSVARDEDAAEALFLAANAKTSSPLYVLVWGNMRLFSRLLRDNPTLAPNLRLITIGTGLMLEKDLPFLPESWPKSAPCEQLNWNGFGRNEIYQDDRFSAMWWVEMNWTYAGMFSGEGPQEMFDSLAAFGSMGQHIKDVVKNEDWAQYFRVGDTPSVLYLLDPGHELDDPQASSWAGQFVQPFPDSRPHYFTDYAGDLDWNYGDPCTSWSLHEQVQVVASGTLEARRGEMYAALLAKLRLLYGLQ